MAAADFRPHRRLRRPERGSLNFGRHGGLPQRDAAQEGRRHLAANAEADALWGLVELQIGQAERTTHPQPDVAQGCLRTARYLIAHRRQAEPDCGPPLGRARTRIRAERK